MAEQDPGSRHALQYKGQVKSFSSKDILAQLAAAQTQSATHSEARTAAPPSQSAAPPVPVSVATPPKGDAKATNFHALQYTGQVKKFTSSSVCACERSRRAVCARTRVRAREQAPTRRLAHTTRLAAHAARAGAAAVHARDGGGHQLASGRAQPQRPREARRGLVLGTASPAGGLSHRPGHPWRRAATAAADRDDRPVGRIPGVDERAGCVGERWRERPAHGCATAAAASAG